MSTAQYDLYSKMSSAIDQYTQDCPGGICAATGVCAASLAFLYYGINKVIGKSRNNVKIRKAQARKQESVDKLRKRLEDLSQMIDKTLVDIPFKDLQQKLQSGKLTCREVLLAYQAKALEVHDKTNCVTGFIGDAEERANRLDSLPVNERGPLHGIPVSVKEVVGIKGEDCTSGLAYCIDKPLSDYGVLIKVLMKQGAIPFARTNISQAQLGLSSSNPIYGESTNPTDPGRTCGGSSGGEGSLLGGNASVLGIGCDMAGSIRIPSHFCGSCGFKPTQNRLSGAGNLPMNHGIVTLGEIFGPMGRDVNTIVAMMKAALVPDMYTLDPLLPKLPWNEEIYLSSKPLKIGFYLHDGGLEPVPAVKRGVLVAKKALESMGHTVVPFTPTDVVKAVKDFGLGILFSDYGETINEVLVNDIVDPCIAGALFLFKIPGCIRRMLAKVLGFLHPTEKELLSAEPAGTVYNWWKLNERVEEFRREFFNSMQQQGLDAIICPPFPVAAWPLKDDRQALVCATYTLLYNILNVPCGVIPVTRVSNEDISKMDGYPKSCLAERFVHRISKGSENLPIGVQGVSYPFMEEVTLRVLRDVETGLEKNGESFNGDISSGV